MWVTGASSGSKCSHGEGGVSCATIWSGLTVYGENFHHGAKSFLYVKVLKSVRTLNGVYTQYNGLGIQKNIVTVITCGMPSTGVLCVTVYVVGEEMCYQLSKMGAKLILSARNEQKLKQVKSSLANPGDAKLVCTREEACFRGCLLRISILPLAVAFQGSIRDGGVVVLCQGSIRDGALQFLVPDGNTTTSPSLMEPPPLPHP